jgi:hypothetical protein
MISATPSPSFDELVTRLATAAGQLAQARVKDDARAAADDPGRWRDPGLLWPDFAVSTSAKG